MKWKRRVNKKWRMFACIVKNIDATAAALSREEEREEDEGKTTGSIRFFGLAFSCLEFFLFFLSAIWPLLSSALHVYSRLNKHRHPPSHPFPVHSSVIGIYIADAVECMPDSGLNIISAVCFLLNRLMEWKKTSGLHEEGGPGARREHEGWERKKEEEQIHTRLDGKKIPFWSNIKRMKLHVQDIQVDAYK